MPVVQSIDGVFLLYQDRRGPPRHKALARSRTIAPLEEKAAPNPACREGAGARTHKPVVLARDIMSTPVMTLPASAPLVQAWTVMRSRQFCHLPIVADSGTLVGMMSEHDLLHASHGTEGRVLPPFPLVREVMTREFISATPETPMREIIEVMLDEQVGAVPILNDRHHPIGILTRTDMFRALLDRAPLELGT